MAHHHELYMTAKYCAMVALAALALLAAVAVFNAVIDPFGMYFLVNVKGFNAYKPDIYTRVRLFKAYGVMRVRPQTIILGTSRSHIGFRCSHKAFARIEGPCYNLAFDGATSKEMFLFLRHAEAVRPLRHVLLGLDPYHLAPGPVSTRPDFDPLVLFDPDRVALPRWLTGDLRLLTSLDTLKASLETLKAQDANQPSWFGPDGQRLGELYFRKVDPEFAHLGPRGYLDLVDRREVGFQTDWMVAAAQRKASHRPDPPFNDDETSLAYVRRIIEFCREHDIDLRIVITPAHAHQMEIMAASSGWQELETKKRALVRLVAEDAAQHPGQAPFPVFDFGGYSSITEEPLPPPGSREEMKYYWDSSHFKQIVGDYVLDRVYGVSSPTRQAPKDFGIRLTPAAIEPYLADQRFRQADYRARFPGDVATLHGLVARALNLQVVSDHVVRRGPDRVQDGGKAENSRNGGYM
jgi:hypothetical protein